MPTLLCRETGTPFTLSSAEHACYERMQIPLPTLSPARRQQHKLAWRNEDSLYTRVCDLCGERIVCVYHPTYLGPVYCSGCWWGDRWDASALGQKLRFDRPFFEQFAELLLRVPRLGLHQLKSQNAEYTNYASDNKNGYLLVNAAYNEDCQYSERLFHCRDCYDCFNLDRCERAYASSTCKNCFDIGFCEYATACSDCWYCYDCRSCQNCFGCFGLRNREYCFFNEQLSHDDYDRELKKLALGDRAGIDAVLERSRAHFLRYPHRYAWVFNSENVTGDFVDRAKNSSHIFYAEEVEESSYLYGGYHTRHCYDCIPADESELCLQCMSTWRNYNLLFCMSCWEGHDLTYSDLCPESNNCFGCIGVRHGQYMILNTRYTKEEYEELVPKVIAHMRSTGEWGTFFPEELSPFAYNETAAQDAFPLTQEDALAKGRKWMQREPGTAQTSSQDPAIHHCTLCERPFRINRQEATFYASIGLPHPHHCPRCRRRKMMEQRNPMQLWLRQCMHEWEADGKLTQCPNTFHSPFVPTKPEILYCDQCYRGVYE